MENYETLMKEIEILQAGEDIQYSWVERITIVKMTILPNVIYSLNATLSKDQGQFHKTRKILII